MKITKLGFKLLKLLLRCFDLIWGVVTFGTWFMAGKTTVPVVLIGLESAAFSICDRCSPCFLYGDCGRSNLLTCSGWMRRVRWKKSSRKGGPIDVAFDFWWTLFVSTWWVSFLVIHSCISIGKLVWRSLSHPPIPFWHLIWPGVFLGPSRTEWTNMAAGVGVFEANGYQVLAFGLTVAKVEQLATHFGGDLWGGAMWKPNTFVTSPTSFWSAWPKNCRNSEPNYCTLTVVATGV